MLVVTIATAWLEFLFNGLHELPVVDLPASRRPLTLHQRPGSLPGARHADVVPSQAEVFVVVGLSSPLYHRTSRKTWEHFFTVVLVGGKVVE